MALVCRECKGDIIGTAAGDRGNCLSCGAVIDLATGRRTEGGLVWTSEVPEAVATTAAVTQAAAT